MLEVDLCNIALSNLGHQPIESFSEASPAGDACRVHFHVVRKKILRGAFWGCARKVADLVEIGDWTSRSWSRAFLYPTDALAIWFLEPQGGKFPAFTTAVHNGERVILTNAADPVAHYVYDSEDYDLWDSMLVDAFTAGLTAALAIPLTGNADLAAYHLKRAQAAILEAQAVAFNELTRTYRDIQPPSMLRVATGQQDPLQLDTGQIDTGGYGSELG